MAASLSWPLRWVRHRRPSSRGVCRRCILTDAVPGITLDAVTGLCTLCQEQAHGATGDRHELGEAAFLQALAPSRARDRYDCLCLYSGGKDSTYMLYVLAKRMKLRVLAMTLDNWFLSPQTHVNIQNTLRRLETVDHIVVRPSWSTVQQFFQAGFCSSEARRSVTRPT